MSLKLLFIGDIVGRPGREAIREWVPSLRREYEPDFVIANAENAAAGSGLTAALAQDLLNYGLDGLTLGNHIWGQKGFDAVIGGLKRVCRPANLPKRCPGQPFLILENKGFTLGVATLMGAKGMDLCGDCPFQAADALIDLLKPQVDVLVFEIHAEYTSEKMALGWYLDGRIGALVGTHTHVPTADTRLLPKKTAYQTDLGMTGPHDSVLGRQVQPVVDRFLDRMPRLLPVAQENVQLWGCLITLDPATGLALGIERIARGVA